MQCIFVNAPADIPREEPRVFRCRGFSVGYEENGMELLYTHARARAHTHILSTYTAASARRYFLFM